MARKSLTMLYETGRCSPGFCGSGYTFSFFVELQLPW